ncbi:MAG: type 1 glutamine amidotransferase [Actinomycetota bacterium]|nr:type 1 glutamine amidotransferase [Actinomycetota bacterium]
MTHLLVLQLSETDPPERLGDWLREAGAGVDVRYAPDGVPETLDGVDALVCLGGGMGAQDDARHPWLADVRRLLADAVTSRVPTLGVCLGAQLLAVATGGGVRRGELGPEVGALLVAKRDAAAVDPLFAPVPLTPDVIQFHHDEISQLPPAATLLASSPRYPNQAFRIGPCAYGIQFHIETTPATVLAWAQHDPEAATAPAGRLEPAHLEQAHADLAEVWRPFAQRFVALAAGEIAGERPTLPLLTH